MAESTLTRCKCGDPLFVKVEAHGDSTYLACHHCERPCVLQECPRCKQIGEWYPDVEGPGYNDFKGPRRKGGGPG